MVTQERLKELFTYDPEGYLVRTGKYKRKKRTAPFKGHEYREHQVDYKMYLEHRLIFLYHHGYLPEFLDHIDGNKENNRIENLRACSLSQNNFNRKLHSNNTSGIKGVSWDKPHGKYRASVKTGKGITKVKYSNDLDELKTWVDKTREELHGEFARHG